MSNSNKILIYGYGNPGRRDDGLGVIMTEMIENWVKSNNLTQIDVDSNYQLNVEDAEKISSYGLVIFVDASQEEDLPGFKMTDIVPNKNMVEFTMHAVSPAYILHLTNDLFNKHPDAKLLSIRGYRWEFKEGLSEKAQHNLESAYSFLLSELTNWLQLENQKINCL